MHPDDIVLRCVAQAGHYKGQRQPAITLIIWGQVSPGTYIAGKNNDRFVPVLPV